MRKKFLSILLSLSMVSSLSVMTNLTKTVDVVKASEKEAVSNNEFAPDRVIVSVIPTDRSIGAESVFDDLDIKNIERLDKAKTPKSERSKQNDVVSGESIENSIYLITLADEGKENVLEAIKVLKENPNVKYAEPDYIVTGDDSNFVDNLNDTYVDELYGMNRISAPLAWNVTTGSCDVVVGIIDSGIDYNHPDLKDNVWTNEGEIPGDGIDNDGNGYIDDVHGWNFVSNTNDPMDDHEHGTHVAGTIGAIGNNGQGVVGVTMHVKMAALKFLNSENKGYTSDAIEALRYANKMGMPITNNSWGGGDYSDILYDEIKKSGLFIAAAGNNTTDLDSSPYYPACYDSENVITVAATASNDSLCSFSSYGAREVDIAAPGLSIYSTVPNGNYDYLSGTSMATPHVTGAIALLKSYYPDYTSAQLKAAILDNTDRIQALNGKVATGRLNLAKAFGRVTEYQGVDYKDVFDYDCYKGSFQDAYNAYKKSPLAALKHFVEIGMSDGRPASDDFNVRAYQKRYKDLSKQFGTDWRQYYLHYINTGKAEGRVGVKDFKPGDLNGDGMMDENDLRSMTSAIHFYSLAKSEGNRWYEASADMDCDMDIDSDDYEDLEIRIRDLAMPVTLLGDVNKDGVVDYYDLNSMPGALRAYAMGRSEHNPNVCYTPEADLDRDGDNDSDDYDLLVELVQNA